MIYITGDKHRDYSDVREFCKKEKTTKDDILIVLGDNGVNFFNKESDYICKKYLSEIPITFFFIKGNHDKRPEKIPSYQESKFWNGTVYIEPEFPNLIFAKDGEVYYIDGKSALVIGGAWSIDKEYRLRKGLQWFSDEQPTPQIKASVEALTSSVNDFDFILTHTCPSSFVAFSGIRVATGDDIDNSTEEWLEGIKNKIHFGKWYCGHWHIDQNHNKFRFMYHDIVPLNLL